jgi:hypothetical protein
VKFIERRRAARKAAAEAMERGDAPLTDAPGGDTSTEDTPVGEAR